LSSFTRTIPSGKAEDYVREILSRADHFAPLAYRPAKARSGNFIYLIFCGVIVGRARISRIDPADSNAYRRSQRYPSWAKWIIRHAGRWERPPRDIHVQGHQSVRYLETHSLEYLDDETW
jgi:hypothetical protein